ncbi:MAG: putative amidohydrolase YtcJ [Yoonia sp.]|jgi:predicted amidohydrolase YtcJ
MRILVVLLLLTSAGCGFQTEDADLVVHNATIYTVDAGFTIYEAMAIKDGKILELGPERQILNKYNAKSNYDAQKRSVYPGLIDAHCHFLAYGLGLKNIDLVGTSSWEEVKSRIASYVPANQEEWIIGRGWDQNDWESHAFPTASQIDEVFPNNPVFMTRIDGHAALVNSKVIELLDLNNQADIEGGAILRDEKGEVTGVLIDNAIKLVNKIIPKPDSEAKRKALLAAQKDCFAVGLTTVDDAGLLKSEVELIKAMQDEQALKMRVYVMLSDTPENLDHYTSAGPYKDEMLNVSAFKFYADGSLGSRGACLIQPYSDRDSSGERGFMLSTEAHYRACAEKLFETGFQMNTHCIGDSANRMILGIYADVLKGVNDRRWRIEHAQVVHKIDVPYFGAYSILPSIQPTHATSDMYWAEMRLGRNRIRRAYAYKELLAQNGMVALGTDFPVEGISPLRTFYAAVVRKDQDGFPASGFQKENSLTRKEALQGMTIWAAISNFEEEIKGSLEVNKLADFVVMDRDLMTVSEDQLIEAKPVATFINGECVFEKK